MGDVVDGAVVGDVGDVVGGFGHGRKHSMMTKPPVLVPADTSPAVPFRFTHPAPGPPPGHAGGVPEGKYSLHTLTKSTPP